MGQAKIKRRSTAEFIQNHPFCSLCGGDRSTVSREHMPPRALFENKHRPDKLVMPACEECNKGTSTADLVSSIISRWGYDATAHSKTDHAKLAAQAKIQAPELVREWMSVDSPTEQLRARAHLATNGVNAPQDARFTTIGPLTIRQLNVFAHKVTLALFFEHFGRPLTNGGRIQAIWKTKEDFYQKGVPQELLGIMGRYNALIQGRWNTAETFEYRYDLNPTEGLFGCFARFRQGLFVLGFAVEDGKTLVDNPGLNGKWIAPRELLAANPHFDKKLG